MLTSRRSPEPAMSTQRLPIPIPLVAPWPLRAARALARSVTRLWSIPHPGRMPEGAPVEWDTRMLDDIGAPPEWRRAAEATHALHELERARWRMQGMQPMRGPDRY
jgi:hypothetical protein